MATERGRESAGVTTATGEPAAAARSSSAAPPAAAPSQPDAGSGHTTDRLVQAWNRLPAVKWLMLVLIPAAFIVGFWSDVKEIFFQQQIVVPLANQVRLGVMWKSTLGDDVPVDEQTPILAQGTPLVLSFSDHPNHFCYLLEIDGQGDAVIYDEQQVRQYEWRWQTTSVPNTQTLMMLVSRTEMDQVQRDQLIAEIEACLKSGDEKCMHQVGAGLQYVWYDQQFVVRKLAIDERPPGWPPGTPTTWCDSLITLIKKRDLRVSGVTLPVAPATE